MVDNSTLTSLFTPAYWSSNTSISSTPTIYSSGTYPGWHSAEWSEPTMTKAKQDPLSWLKAEIGRYVELGTLDD